MDTLTDDKAKETANAALEELKARLAEMADIGGAVSLLSWDQNTYMPAGGAAARAQVMSTLSGLHHERLADPRVGELLESLQGTFDEGSDEAALSRVTKREYDQATKLPRDFVESFAHVTSESQGIWAEARSRSDFSPFAPALKSVLEHSRRYADYLGFDDHPYNALHDLYERGSTVERVRTVFAELRDATVPLVKAVAARSAEVSDAPVHRAFDEGKQEQFGVEVVKDFGYDFSKGRLDRTVHPFATQIGRGDVRITTRYEPNFLNPALFGTMHEAGHAMYEQGLPEAHARDPLGHAVSLGLHESQSRLWENLVGRSYGFWTHAYPRLQELFPEALGEVSSDAFYGAVNRVEPSLIRVEADEVTYNLHVMVRFELELALLEGSLEVKNLPEAWNAKYQDYLGVTPPNDAEGCLQDIHWSIGLIGYFPTYTLGNIMSVQLFEAAKRAHPEIDSETARGKFGTLLGWLRENVHQHGSKYEPAELLKRATGSELDAKPYIRYLNSKFGALYGLE